VLFFPNGLAGLYEDFVKRPVLKLVSRARRPRGADVPSGAPAE